MNAMSKLLVAAVTTLSLAGPVLAAPPMKFIKASYAKRLVLEELNASAGKLNWKISFDKDMYKFTDVHFTASAEDAKLPGIKLGLPMYEGRVSLQKAFWVPPGRNRVTFPYEQRQKMRRNRDLIPALMKALSAAQ